GLRTNRDEPARRDGITLGVLGLLLALLLLVIPVGYTLDYAIEGAGAFTLTGIILAVGVFGGYAAIVAVFLAIAGLSPRRQILVTDAAAEDTADADRPA